MVQYTVIKEFDRPMIAKDGVPVLHLGLYKDNPFPVDLTEFAENLKDLLNDNKPLFNIKNPNGVELRFQRADGAKGAKFAGCFYSRKAGEDEYNSKPCLELTIVGEE